MKISLVIPHFPSIATDIVLHNSLESFKGHYDELIIISNEGMGYGPAVNMGLKYTTGDYIIVSNNDIELKSGSFKTLPWDKGFSVPTIEPEPRDYLPRSIFCMPRWVYDLIMNCDGFFYDPIFECGFWEDDDLHKRTTNIPIIREGSITVNHLNGGGMTMKQMGEQRWMDINRKVFLKKWG